MLLTATNCSNSLCFLPTYAGPEAGPSSSTSAHVHVPEVQERFPPTAGELLIVSPCSLDSLLGDYMAEAARFKEELGDEVEELDYSGSRLFYQRELLFFRRHDQAASLQRERTGGNGGETVRAEQAQAGEDQGMESPSTESDGSFKAVDEGVSASDEDGDASESSGYDSPIGESLSERVSEPPFSVVDEEESGYAEAGELEEAAVPISVSIGDVVGELEEGEVPEPSSGLEILVSPGAVEEESVALSSHRVRTSFLCCLCHS